MNFGYLRDGVIHETVTLNEALDAANLVQTAAYKRNTRGWTIVRTGVAHELKFPLMIEAA